MSVPDITNLGFRLISINPGAPVRALILCSGKLTRSEDVLSAITQVAVQGSCPFSNVVHFQLSFVDSISMLCGVLVRYKNCVILPNQNRATNILTTTGIFCNRMLLKTEG